MKKIIAVLLTVVCILSFASCGKQSTVAKMYENSYPTRIHVVTTQSFFGYTLQGDYLIVRGQVNGRKASRYTYDYKQLAAIGDYAASGMIGTSGMVEYWEGRGIREEGGVWDLDEEAKDVAPQMGEIALNLEKGISDFKYENHVATFTVKAADTATVFGSALSVKSDVKVTVTDGGGVITGVTMEYTVPATEQVEAIAVRIVADYTYNIEKITFK